jgi:hypothetical protein
MTSTAHRGPRPAYYQRIVLDGSETRADLLARGMPSRTVTRARTRGWYTTHYHTPQYPQEEGPGQFAALQNPYAFAMAQVQHVVRERAYSLPRQDLDDAIQDAVLWAWERRHCTHIADFVGYISTVIREKLRTRFARQGGVV